MEFYTSFSQKRPIRLPEKTRKFAYESLNHRYGIATRNNPNVEISCDKTEKIDLYDTAVYEIVKNAPIRICDNELLSGAATLGDAIGHQIPVLFNGEFRLDGLSHLTVDFFEVLEIGMDGIKEKAVKALDMHTEPYKLRFIKSCLHCIDCMKIWHTRYIEALKLKSGYEKNIENLLQVPFKPARNFYEAVQCVWLCFAFLRLLGNWPGIGRIDLMLGKYLKKDLAQGVITLDEARNILAHFFIKGCEWIDGQKGVSGDAQHYQNIVLSGIDEDGNDATNEVTYLVLDIIEETGISDFPTTVRINKNTDEKLMKRICEVIRYGGGVIAVYNEDLVINTFIDKGYGEKEARTFANDGCWEVQIPGKTNFLYMPFDSLAILQKYVLDGYQRSDFKNFEELRNAYKSELRNTVKVIVENTFSAMLNEDKTTFRQQTPCTAVSLFEGSCIEKGLSYREGGTDYIVRSPHIGGLPDTANSLYAIKKAVFDDKIITFSELMSALRKNWEGYEELRLHMLNSYSYFGNDNDEVDLIAADIANTFSDYCAEWDGKTVIRIIAGISTFGRQIEWSGSRLATPFGRKKGEILSGNFSPTPGTAEDGAAAIIKSHCKADLSKQHSGAALDIGLVPSGTDSDNAVIALGGLIKSFVELGGFFMQIDTVDKATLIDAQNNPLNYKNLSVRVSGWNARFVTMNKEWQDCVIERTPN